MDLFERLGRALEDGTVWNFVLLVAWILLLAFLLSERAGAGDLADGITYICDIPNERGQVETDTDDCPGPRYYPVYEFWVPEVRGWKKFLIETSFYRRIDCQELGSWIVKQGFHEHSRFECIPNKP